MFKNVFRRFHQNIDHRQITLYLHIGMPKTGSTALQHFLYAHRDNLMRDQGILYPEGAVPHYQHVSLVKSLVLPIYRWAIFNNAIESFDVKNYMDHLISGCHFNQCRKVILSSEYFWASPAMQAGLDHHGDTLENRRDLDAFVRLCKVALSGFSQIKIIVYLRRQDYWFDSFFNEQLKNGFQIPTEEELIPHKVYLLYDICIQMWEEHFGPENVMVRAYLENGFDVIHDFCSIVGIRQNEIHVDPKESIENQNIRLSPIASEVMKKTVELGYDMQTLELLKKVLRHTSCASYSPEKAFKLTLFSKEFYQNVLSIYKKENTLLASRYEAVGRLMDQENTTKGAVEETNTLEFKFEQQVEFLLNRLLEKQKIH